LKLEIWKNIGKVLVERDEKGHFITWRKAVLYRFAMGSRGVVVHNIYYSFTVYYYSSDSDPDNVPWDLMEDKLYDEIENVVGYPPEEWWFIPVVYRQDVPTELEYDESLDGEIEVEQPEVIR